MRTLRKLVLVVAASLLAGSPLLAHHAWPVDQSKRIRLQGTVTGFTWANPHVMIALDVEGNGASEKWTVGGSSPQFMATCGWKRDSLKPGDVITVIGYRYKDGSNAALMQTIVVPNGKEMFYGVPPGPAAKCMPRAGDAPIHVIGRAGLRGVALDHHRVAVDEDLGRIRHDVRRREADADDGVGAAATGFRHHSVDRLLARFGHQLGVLLDLAADEVLERCQDVLADVARPDGIAVDQPETPHHAVPWDLSRRRDDHRMTSLE